MVNKIKTIARRGRERENRICGSDEAHSNRPYVKHPCGMRMWVGLKLSIRPCDFVKTQRREKGEERIPFCTEKRRRIKKKKKKKEIFL